MTEILKLNSHHNVAVVQRFYGAAATHDTSKVVSVLTEDFVGTTTEGLVQRKWT